MGIMFRLSFIAALCVSLVGCAGPSSSSPALNDQARAGLVIQFQSWNSIQFIKPDITGATGGLTTRAKSFNGEAVAKILRNLKTPRDLVVVVMDRRHQPDPTTVGGGMDTLEKYFKEMGFRQIIFQDSVELEREGGHPVMRDVILTE
jgi:hypothetical protein